MITLREYLTLMKFDWDSGRVMVLGPADPDEAAREVLIAEVEAEERGEQGQHRSACRHSLMLADDSVLDWNIDSDPAWEGARHSMPSGLYYGPTFIAQDDRWTYLSVGDKGGSRSIVKFPRDIGDWEGMHMRVPDALCAWAVS